MKKAGKIIAYMAIIAGYAAVSFLIMYLVSKSGVYPSGSDTMCHIYKGSVLYQQIKQGNWYPLFDPMWYNGVEMMRYWAPLPVYFLAMCQAFAGGDCFGGYLVFLGLVSFFGAVVWFFIGCRHKRPWMGAVIGLLWFFMPNNLLAIFVEGNLPRALCMVVLPLFVANVHDYLLDGRWKSLPQITICFVFMTLCHTGYAGMIALALLVFLVIFRILYRQRRRIFEVLFAVILGFALTGIWMYASLQGGITSTDSSQVMQGFFQDAVISLNPFHRITDGQGYFYFGLAAFLLIVFGMFFAKRKSLPGFWAAFLIFLCTTTTMYSVLVLLPGSQYLWMLRFISIALCFALYSFLLWKTLKKPFVIVIVALLFLDVVPSLQLVYGETSGVTPQERYESMSEYTLIGEAKEITSQRLALLDLSTLGADGAYLVSREEDGVPAVFGAGWQSAATAQRISLLNESLEKGNYLYLFDRCIELGSDTVLIRVSQASAKEEDIPNIDAAAEKLGYSVVDSNSDYRLYHLDAPECFGVVSEFDAIGIGRSASLMALQFPVIEETTDTNLNHYSYDELSRYQVIYLAGFTYDDREAAEDMLLQLSENGTRIVILADGIPVDKQTGTQSFLDVDCHSITFSNGYPELDTVDGILYCDLFPEGYTKWKTVYMNGLDDVWGTTADLDNELEIYGTKYNDNLIFIGLNLTYHYSLTKDEAVGALLAHALDLDAEALPERTIVPLDITYDADRITITSAYDDVDTTIAIHDIFESGQSFYSKNYLTYVDAGTTVITMACPYLLEGAAVSGVAVILTGLFWWYTKRRWKKEQKIQDVL